MLTSVKVPKYLSNNTLPLTTLIPRCYQGLGTMASELRMKLINMKGEGSSRQKEEANIVLQVLWNSHKITQVMPLVGAYPCLKMSFSEDESLNLFSFLRSLRGEVLCLVLASSQSREAQSLECYRRLSPISSFLSNSKCPPIDKNLIFSLNQIFLSLENLFFLKISDITR